MNKKLDAIQCRSFADRDFDSDDYAKTFVKYSRALKNQPHDSDSLSQMIRVLYFLRKYETAEVKTRKLIILNPASASAYFYRGLIFSALKKYDKSEIAYKEALKYEPDAAEIHHNLSRVLNKQGRYLESLESCERTVKIVPYDDSAWNIKGYVHFLMGNYEEAVVSLGKAISFNPEECMAYLNKAIVYHLLGKKEEAKEILDLMYRVAVNETGYTEEFEIYSDELSTVEKMDCEGKESEENQRRACIEGLKFIMNFLQTDLKVKLKT